mgnify:CR=1 FL=1
MVFADGPERGLEAVIMSAGPLALTVLAGRAMDIGSLTWQGVPIGWTGPSGYVSAAYLDAESDGGRGFDSESLGVNMAGPSEERGRGMALMAALVDSVRFESRPEAGTIVHLVKDLALRPDGPLRRLVEPSTT